MQVAEAFSDRAVFRKVVTDGLERDLLIVLSLQAKQLVGITSAKVATHAVLLIACIALQVVIRLVLAVDRQICHHQLCKLCQAE